MLRMTVDSRSQSLVASLAWTPRFGHRRPQTSIKYSHSFSEFSTSESGSLKCWPPVDSKRPSFGLILRANLQSSDSVHWKEFYFSRCADTISNVTHKIENGISCLYSNIVCTLTPSAVKCVARPYWSLRTSRKKTIWNGEQRIYISWIQFGWWNYSTGRE